MTYCDCVVTAAAAPTETVAPVVAAQDGSATFRCRLPAGLHQFSAIADAGRFDWNELYVELSKFGNTGQRTGPWDFNLLDANKPLVPSYWVTVQGRRIGLWHFERVSIPDIAGRRFRGRFAFWNREPGPVEIHLVPYRPLDIRWTSARLEPDPEDSLATEFPLSRFRLEKLNARRMAAPEYWATKRRLLAEHGDLFAEPLKRASAWALAKSNATVLELPVLLGAHHLQGEGAAATRALELVDAASALPHWGNPAADGYAHNGDMGAAKMLRVLAWAYHACGPLLGPERRSRLRAKLAHQAERFLELALLNRDYWGGSVMQDHGRVSLAAYGAAVLHLLGELPDAERWGAYAVPRVFRSIEAMPRDGAIPLSSYAMPYLYLDEMMHFRDALVDMAGVDVLDAGPFAAIIDYLVAVVHPREQAMILSAESGGDRFPFCGGNVFLNRMAQTQGDARAARLHRLLLAAPPGNFYHPTREEAFYHGALWGFLSFDPAFAAAGDLPPPLPLSFFPDTGLVHYRDDAVGVTLSLRCGPWLGYHGYRQAQGPSDRLGLAPGAGHFIVAIDGRPLLTTPDSGYRLHSALRSCLLIDGKGQRDDIGYPMSIPSKRHAGEEIQFARWDAATGIGWIRLNLAPVYPDDAGVVAYTRDFHVAAGQKQIVCRDAVVLRDPKPLSWLFQGKEETGLTCAGTRCQFGRSPVLMLEARPTGCELRSRIARTEVVWAYASSSGFKPFCHARFDCIAPVATATVDFVLTW